MSKELRAEGEPYRQLAVLIGSVKDYAIFMLDQGGRVISWNPGACAIKGYDEAEILGVHFSRFYTDEDRAADKPTQLLKAAARLGRMEDEGWRVRKDGSRFWADVVISAIRNDAGELVGFAKVTRDLSERKKAEDLLRQSETRLRLMVESVKDYAIFMLDPEGRVASWNAGAERLKGYTAGEIIGQHFSRFYPDVEIDRGTPCAELGAAAEHERFEDEGWRVRKDGTRFWASVVISAVRNVEGELLGYTKIIRDMSERRRAVQELASRAKQQATVAWLGVHALRSRDPQALLDEAVKCVATTLDAELVSVFELRRESPTLLLCAGVGWRPGLVGHAVMPVENGSLGGFTLHAAEPVLLEDVAAENRFVVPEILREHHVACGITAAIDLPDGAGPCGVFGVHSRQRRDFSPDDVHFLLAVTSVIGSALARHRTGELLQHAEEVATHERLRAARAREALRERDEFIAVAAHELRTPLTALLLKLQGLERVVEIDLAQVGRTSTIGHRLADALRQTQRLVELAERLIDVSRIVTGRLELQLEELDLGALARAVIEDFGDRAVQARSEILLEVSGDARGMWDRHRLEQVLANLLSNALKYGRHLPIQVTVEGTTQVRLAVSDRGIGISPEDVDRIFGRFERAAPLRHYGGLGLGLYLARHIVTAHGGAIRVSTEEGKGSTFVVELPRRPALSSMPTSTTVNTREGN